MSHIFRDKSSSNQSKRHQQLPQTPISSTSSPSVTPKRTSTSSQKLPSPFDDLVFTLTDAELRETAYEIFVGSCRSSAGSRPLTYIPQSEKLDRSSSNVSLSPFLQRSLTSSAASKVKKALGLKPSPSTKKIDNGGGGGRTGTKKTITTAELVRVQMKVTEQTDTRIRRALLRIAAGQIGKRIESFVLPLELLQQFKSIDFSNQQEYEAWQKRNFKVLEAGLLLFPHLSLDKKDTNVQRLQQIISGALQKPIEAGKHYDTMQQLRNSVMALACRSFNGSTPETCHWADGFPLNLRLYQMLLEACFDVSQETLIIEEIDEVLELLQKTWGVLGLNQKLHNLCFAWVLFHRYFSTGEVEDDLLFAANNLLVEIEKDVVEVEKDVRDTKDPIYLKILSSTLKSMMDWADKKLVAYHDTFNTDNIDSIQNVVSVALLAAKILKQDMSNGRNKKKNNEVDIAHESVNSFIRSSMTYAFSQLAKNLASNKRTGDHGKYLPMLSSLAQDTSKLAFREKSMYSPMLKRWHPLAAGVAVTILHACYGKELKQYVAGITELTPDAVQVLNAADKLETDLVQIAVEESVDSEDGGMSIIKKMPPYEAEAVLSKLVKLWIKTRVERLTEWVDRNLQQEEWNPRANKDKFAPSSVEVLRIVDETLEAFFLLPISMHQILLPDFMRGLDESLQHYVIKTKSGCGTKNTFIPTMPALTRCVRESKLHGVFKKKEKSSSKKKTSHVGEDSLGTAELCVRINSLQYIRTELEVLEKRCISHLRNLKSYNPDDFSNGSAKRFELSATACTQGIQQLCETTAYKVVFRDLSHVFWDGLYVGEVTGCRIEPYLVELEHNLETIASTVNDRVRTRLITDLMKASFDGFLLVLLAGGPSRAFTPQDSAIIAEDFKFLSDLFWSNGDGLPSELIDKHSTVVEGIIPLLVTDSETLIDQFKRLITECYASTAKSTAKSRLPLPPTSDHWSPKEPNTLLRVLCYRNDEIATKFLKKTYNLPKKL